MMDLPENCENCSGTFPRDDMFMDNDALWFCEPCWDELILINKEEWEELDSEEQKRLLMENGPSLDLFPTSEKLEGDRLPGIRLWMQTRSLCL